MLTCDDVRAELPLLATGEAARGEVRDHLATCEACRAEEEALRADLDRVRGDLAALAPSPFLEERVAQLAREPARPGSGHRLHPWLGAAIAVAAAALLAAVFVLPRSSGPAGEVRG